jgi:hypothetical protein
LLISLVLEHAIINVPRKGVGLNGTSQPLVFAVHVNLYGHHHHHHHHHVAIKDLDHLLARSGLTRPEVYSKVFLGSFCLWGVAFILSVIEMSPERVTTPEQGKSSGRIATFILWTGVLRDGISSITDEPVIPL